MSDKEEIGEEQLSLNCLPNESLEKVLGSLIIIDKIRFKPVSKRWNGLMKKSLSKQLVVSYKDFPGIRTWTNTKLQGFFAWYGRNVVELSTQRFSANHSICDLLFLLPNLRHLDTASFEMTSFRLTRIANWLPNLLSFSFKWSDGVMESHEISIVRLEKLEFLRCKVPEEFDWYFSFPLSLKYLEADACGYGLSVMRITEQARGLESLLLGYGIRVDEFYTSFNFESLKYLSICAGYGNNLQNDEDLARLVEITPNLLAFDLKIHEENRLNLSGCLKTIGMHGEKLQHVGVTCDFAQSLDFKDAVLNLSSLTSLSIWYRCGSGKYICPAFQTFFEQVTAFGKLELFETNFYLSVESICKAVKFCKNLKRIRCRYDSLEDWNCLSETLDGIHGSGTVPEVEEDYKQVLHIFNYHRNPIKHPWIRFHEKYINSPIAEQIRFGCLTEKPKFADDFY